jgi:hypothetical protein
MEVKMDIKEYIKSKRPNLSEGSLKTYASILKSLYRKVFGEGEIDYSKFSEVEPIQDFLEPIPFNKRKTILSALVVITGLQPYKTMMEKDVKDYNEDIAKQEPTETQEEAWIEKEDIDRVFNAYEKQAKVLMKKPNLTQAELQEIQNYIILVLLSGKFTPVRRAKDWTDFKIRNAVPDKDNYIEGNNLVFNSYKTAFAYGQQKEKLSIKLKNILKKWIELNPTDYLLFDANMNPLTSVKLNQRLNKIFGKKAGINALRHSVLTDKFAETIPLQQNIEETMTGMGTSPAMLTTYVKARKPRAKKGELSATAKAWVDEQNKKWDGARK